MKTEKTKHKDFDKVVKPVMKWLKKNCHPHMKVIIDSNVAELVEGQKTCVIKK